MEQYKKQNGLRVLIISGLSKQDKIKFIQKRDSSFTADNLARFGEKEIHNIALAVDCNHLTDRQKKKNKK